MRLTNHLQLELRLRKGGDKTPLHLYALMVCMSKTLTFVFVRYLNVIVTEGSDIISKHGSITGMSRPTCEKIKRLVHIYQTETFIQVHITNESSGQVSPILYCSVLIIADHFIWTTLPFLVF